ncbi:MAG: hypothetical protein ACI4TA_12270 [Acetatifactor sp.]
MNNLETAVNVYLYIDPATTSYIIQIIAGVVIACGAGLGVFWNKLSRYFRKKKADKLNPIEQTDINTSSEFGEKEVVTADDLLADDEK